MEKQCSCDKRFDEAGEINNLCYRLSLMMDTAVTKGCIDVNVLHATCTYVLLMVRDKTQNEDMYNEFIDKAKQNVEKIFEAGSASEEEN